MRISRKTAFYALMWVFILAFCAAGVLTHGQSFVAYLHNFPDDTFMDFYSSMQYGRTPYESQVIYPPLANLIYLIILSFIPEYAAGGLAIRLTQMGRLMLAIYISLSTLLFAYALAKLYKGKTEDKFLLMLTLMLTGPFIYQLERANIIFICLCFILFFICGYDSEKPLIKHLAFISLAIAASLKIYPAVFGLLLIRKKRWTDALICVVYGIVLFVFPIVFFGGLKNFPLFIHNILHASDYMQSTGYGWKVNISNTFGWLGELSGCPALFNSIGACILVLALILGISILLFADYEETWKLYAIPCIMMVAIPGFSFIYSLIYMVLPLIGFLNDTHHKRSDWIYLGLLILMFAPIINPYIQAFDIFSSDYYIFTLSTAIESLAVLAFMILLYAEGALRMWRKLQVKKTSYTSGLNLLFNRFQ